MTGTFFQQKMTLTPFFFFTMKVLDFRPKGGENRNFLMPIVKYVWDKNTNSQELTKI